MSYAERVRGALHDWVSEEAKRPIVWAHQNAPKEAYAADNRGRYAVLTIVGGHQVGQRDEAVYRNQEPADGTDLVESLKGHRTLDISIDLVEGDVDQDMSTLLASVSSTKRQMAFQTAGIGFVRAGEIRNFSEILDSEWEDRRQVDAFFNTFEAFESVVEAIEEVEITSDIGGSIVITPEGVEIQDG